MLYTTPRRRHLPELSDECWRAGFSEAECMYRFRDRMIIGDKRQVHR